MESNTLMLLIIILLLLALFATIAVVYHKLSKAISIVRSEIPVATGNTIKQLEALFALEKELGLPHPLPQTRGWAASPDFLRTLMEHALVHKPQVMVECSSGISTLVLARCAQLNGIGHVHSMEHDPEFAEKTRRMLSAQGLENFATVYDAPLQRLDLPKWKGEWYTHDVLPPSIRIDMLVVDGPPWFVGELPRYPAVPILIEKLITGSFVYLDDADRPEEQEIVRRWMDDNKQFQKIRTPLCEKGCIGLLVGKI